MTDEASSSQLRTTAAPRPPTSGPTRRGAALVACALLVSALNLRIAVTSLSPLLHRIGGDLHFGIGTVSVFAMLPPATFALAAVGTMVLVRHVGPELLGGAAMALTGAGEALRALTTDAVGLIALTVLTLVGAGVTAVVIPPLIRTHFPSSIGRLSSGYLVAFHVGALVPPLVAVMLADASGWRVSIASWAVLALAAAALWALVLLRSARSSTPEGTRRPARSATPGETRRPARSATPGETRRPARSATIDDARHGDVADETPDAPLDAHLGRHVWRSRSVWNLTILFGVVSGDVFLLFSWLPTLVAADGYGPAYGGAMVSLLIAVSLVVALFVPPVVLRLRHAAGLIGVSVALSAAGWTAFALVPRTAMPLWVVVLGAGSSLVVVVQTMINTHATTPVGATVTSAFVQGVGGAIAVVAPLGFGVLHTLTGGWLAPAALVALSLVVIAVTGLRERHHGTLEDEAAATVATVAAVTGDR